MSEATALAEEVVTQPESTPSTPASEAVLAPPSTEEVAQHGTGDETPGTGEGESAPEPATAVDPEQRYAELTAKIDKDGLTPAEGQELKRLTQSLGDKRDAEAKRINDARQVEAQVTQATTNLLGYAQREFDAIEQRENELAEQEGRAPSPARIRAEQKQLLQTFKDRGEVIHQWPIHLDLNARIRAQQPPSARLEEWLTDPRTPIKDKVDFLEAIPRSPSPDHIVMPKKEFDSKYITRAEAKKQLDDFKAANPGFAPPGGGARGAVSGGWTYDRWINATPEERRDAGPEIERQVVSAEMRRRSGGRA